MRVFASRFSPWLKPGDGDKISWEIGEVVSIIDDRNPGLFKITTEGDGHQDVPGEWLRGGYFLDDPEQKSWAMMEKKIWFRDENDREVRSGT